MNKLERLIFIATILDEAGVFTNALEHGLTEEELNIVADMCKEYADKINLKHLELEGLEIIKELARSSKYSH